MCYQVPFRRGALPQLVFAAVWWNVALRSKAFRDIRFQKAAANKTSMFASCLRYLTKEGFLCIERLTPERVE